MSIQVGWFNEEKTLIQYEFVGVWSWDDLFGAIDEAVKLLDSVTHRVDIFLNLAKSTGIPSLSVNGLQRVANAPTATHPNMGIFVMVGMNAFARVSMDIFGKLYPKAFRQYRVANNLETALQVVAKERAI